jgi:RHS repeat-associated protein
MRGAVNNHEHYFADVNGDGKADWIQVNRTINMGRVGLATGDGNFTHWTNDSAMRGAVDNHEHYFADVNGDGKADWIQVNRTINAGHVGLAHGLATDLLISFSSGLGGTTTIGYTPSSAWANTFLPTGTVMQTVSSVTTTDGRGASSTTSYSYAGGLYSSSERRFLGFRKVTAVIDAAGNYTETYYHQHVGCISKPETTYFRSASGAIYTYSSYLYQESATAPYTSLLTERWDYECNLGTTCQRVVSQLGYDAYGNITLAKEYGNYDAAGDERTTVRAFAPNLTKYIVEKASYENVYEGIGTGGRLMSRELRLFDGATSEVTPPLYGDMTARKRWDDQTGLYVTEAFGYDAWGNLISQGDGRGYAKTTAYDGTYHVYPVTRCDALGHCGQTSYDVVLGVATGETDANGQVVTRTYDVLGRPVQETRPDGGWTQWQYLSWGSPTAQRVRVVQSDGSADGLWADEYFDGMQRRYQWVREGGATRLREYSGTTKRVWKESAWYDPTTETARYQVFAYDGAGRVARVTNPDGTYGETAYSICYSAADPDFAAPRACTTRWDELGKATRRATDGLGNLVVVSEWTGAVEARTRYTRDVLSRLTRVVDAAGNVTSKAWSSLGNEVSACDPDLGCWSYGYDAARNRVSSTDARGQTVTVAYDAVGRRVTKTLPGGAVVTWTYDQGATGDRPTSVTWNEGSESLTYDFAGRVTGSSRCVLGECETTEWTYDLVGRVASVTYGDGTVVNHSYDSAGRLLAVGGYASGMSYNARGQLTRLTYGNGVVQQYTYNSPRQWLSAASVTGPGGTLYQASYGYDAAARVTSTSSTTESLLNLTYGYDDRGRLLSVAGGQAQTFTYDAVGNLTSNSQVGSYSYGDAAHKHAVTTAGAGTYSYDAVGNTLSGGGRTLTWDAESRLRTVTRGTLTATFSYDPDGQRTAKTTTAGTTRYYGKLQEKGVDGSRVKYVYAGALQVAQVRTSGTSYVHQDHLGSVRLLTNAAGNVARRYGYAAYGQTVYDSGGATVNAREFGGHEADADLGLVYMNARYYDAELGRFVSADTLVPDLTNPQALNRYAFAYGNPISNIDPTGHAPVVVAVVVACAAPAAVATVAWVGVAFIAVGYVTENPLLMTIGSICLGYAGGFSSALLGGVEGAWLGASVAALTSPLSPIDENSKRNLGLLYMGANFVAGQMKASKALENESAAAKEAAKDSKYDMSKFEDADRARMAAHTAAEASGKTFDEALAAGFADSGKQFGMVGPGTGMTTTVLDKLVGWIPSVRLHGMLHDGYGLAFQTWSVGPGFNYAGVSLLAADNPLSGQFTGLYRNTFMGR